MRNMSACLIAVASSAAYAQDSATVHVRMHKVVSKR